MKLPKYLLIAIVIILSQSILAQWTNPDIGLNGRQILCFENKDSTVLAGTNGGLVRSTNGGTSWTNTGGGLPYPNVRALLDVESYPFDLIAGMVSGRISISTNYGNNFTPFPLESYQLPLLADINCILERSNSSNFLVGTERGVYLLNQYYPFTIWIPINTGLPSAETKVRAIVEKDGDIFVGTNSGVFQLNGFNWVEKNIGLINTSVTALASIDGYLFAGTKQGSVGGVYISSDNGNNWTLSLNDGFVTSILIFGSNIFVGSFGNGVWRTTNYGNTWVQINDGLSSGAYSVLSLGYDSQYLFAGTSASSIWRRPLSQVVTDINEEINLQPEQFSLEQNYPNPFNPSTKIRYSIPTSPLNPSPYQGEGLGVRSVTLKVYDVLGNEVATLVNEVKPAGNYEVDFNASQLSSGIYLYKLQSGDPSSSSGQSFIQTKKMILIK